MNDASPPDQYSPKSPTARYTSAARLPSNPAWSTQSMMMLTALISDGPWVVR
jgi:hypothetical protein